MAADNGQGVRDGGDNEADTEVVLSSVGAADSILDDSIGARLRKALHRKGRLQEVERIYRQILESDRRNA